VTILFKAGDQDPVMPSLEVMGKSWRVSPTQIGSMGLNVGISGSVIRISSLVDVAQPCPEFGVKV
jgi:hypothetical protein